MLALPLLVAFWAAHGLAQSNLNQVNQGVNVTGMNLSGLPQCAQDCLGDSTAEKAQGGCSAIDIKCLCSNTQYINVLACCLDTKCSADDQKKAVDFNSGLCKRVNITIPNFLGCSPGSNPFSNSTTPANVKGGTNSTNGNSGSPHRRQSRHRSWGWRRRSRSHCRLVGLSSVQEAKARRGHPLLQHAIPTLVHGSCESKKRINGHNGSSLWSTVWRPAVCTRAASANLRIAIPFAYSVSTSKT